MMTALIILFFFGIAQTQPQATISTNLQGDITSWYQKGKEFNEQGDWEKALDIWEKGKERLSQHEERDPRIGIAHIRLVTTQKLKDRYSKAVDTYLWGIKAQPNKTYSSFFRDEIERLRHIAGDEQADQWIAMLEDQDPQLGPNIVNF